MSKKTKQFVLPVQGLGELLDLISRSASARQTVRGMLRRKKVDRVDWRGKHTVPTGSVVDVVLKTFHECTDIPLEIPLMSVMSMISARLVRSSARVSLGTQLIDPMLWTVVLAESGVGKTFATNRAFELGGEDRLFPESGSAACFVENLKNWNRTIWLRDEIGQFLKTLEQQPYLIEIRDYLMRIYDGASIERNAKAGDVRIDDPALVILGLSVFETFKNCITAESMVDGFGQRFNYLVARSDPNRRAYDYAIYDVSGVCQVGKLRGLNWRQHQFTRFILSAKELGMNIPRDLKLCFPRRKKYLCHFSAD